MNNIKLYPSYLMMLLICFIFILACSILLLMFNNTITGCLFLVLEIFLIHKIQTNKSILGITINDNELIIDYLTCLQKRKIVINKNDIINCEVLFQSHTVSKNSPGIDTHFTIITETNSTYQISDTNRDFKLFEFLCNHSDKIPNYKQTIESEIKYGLGSKESLDYYNEKKEYPKKILQDQKELHLLVTIIFIFGLIIILPMIISIIIDLLKYYVH